MAAYWSVDSNITSTATVSFGGNYYSTHSTTNYLYPVDYSACSTPYTVEIDDEELLRQKARESSRRESIEAILELRERHQCMKPVTRKSFDSCSAPRLSSRRRSARAVRNWRPRKLS